MVAGAVIGGVISTPAASAAPYPGVRAVCPAPAAPEQISTTATDLLDGDRLRTGSISIADPRTGRIEASGRICTLATGLPASTQVFYGRGKHGFAEGHLYRVGFDGRILEIPAGYQAP